MFYIDQSCLECDKSYIVNKIVEFTIYCFDSGLWHGSEQFSTYNLYVFANRSSF